MPRLPYRPTHTCLPGMVLLGAFSLASAATVEVNVYGFTHTPSPVSGGLAQYVENIPSGVVQGNALSANLARTYAGDNGYGLSGVDSYQTTATATLGVLHSSSSVTVSSTASSTAGWISGDAHSSSSASFSDTARFYDPTYALGALLPVTVGLHVDWAGGYTGSFYGMAQTQANFGILWSGVSLSTYSLMRSDMPVPSIRNDDSVRVMLVNGDTINLSGSLGTTAEASLYNGYVSPGQTVVQSAVSNAANTAHFYIYGDSASASVIGSDGHNYSLMAAVPEPETWAMLLAGLGLLCQVAWAGDRRLRRTA